MLTSEQISKAKELWEEGLGWAEIGRRLGVSRQSIKFVLNRMGLESKTKSGYGKRWDREKALKMLNDGWGITEIARYFDVSHSAISKYMRNVVVKNDYDVEEEI